ncbi:serine hydrolase domain-containing protein [Nannocystis bainbridge]|uniref:Serine hydrolase n=1 Tax=Nannocystis bainbridge TaxID=2995303 RepID=A0ABT5E8I1_9BACT|nr:serine hydrolase [Nannocystis bainbridge]MDC0722171.1 serine hydrolase [Nannocystis bainbridge]
MSKRARRFLVLGSLVVGASCASPAARKATTDAPGSPQEPALVRAVAQHLERLARDRQLSGVVVIAQDGAPIFSGAYGFADLANQVPNRVDTRFNLASMGKMFTGVAILRLVESGQIALDDRVGKHLPTYPNRAVREEVTIHQLLTHTSGLGNFWEAHGKAAKERFKEVADYLPLFVDAPLAFPPGTGFAYSNSGYMVLGLVIEAVTGQRYFDHVTQQVFAPAGMRGAGFDELDQAIPNLAIGYTRASEAPGQWLNNHYVNTVKGSPAGGSYASADDLVRFATALTNHRLLGAAATATLTTGKVAYGKRNYGYGFVEEFTNGRRIVGHGGGHVGIADELLILPELGYTVVILTNGDVENFWDVQSFIKRELLGPTSERASFEFTSRVIEAGAARGYAAGAAVMAEKPAEVTLREGMFEQAVVRLLFEGEVAAAIVTCRLAAAAFPQASFVHLGLADAYRRSGNSQRAIASYRAYLALEPDDAEARRKLQRLLPAGDSPPR